MILTEKIEIKVHHLSLENYKNFGYDVSNGDIINIPPKHLPKNSHEIIKISCDNCDTTQDIQYRVYFRTILKNEEHKYYCNKCNNILREKTNMERYGTPNVFQNIIIKNKWKDNIVKRYGVDHPCKTDAVKNKIYETNLKRYGVKYLMQNEELKSKSIETCIEKYGGNSSACDSEIRSKQAMTSLKKYGYKYTLENKEIFKNMILSKNNSTIKKYKNVIGIENSNYTMQCNRENHIFDIDIHIFHERYNRNILLCTICNPIINGSSKEIELKDFIKENYSEKIIENTREIIKPYEIDLFLPKLKIGFEFNGLFWHSDKYKSKEYHKNKQKYAEENGIKLYNIYEDDWNYKRNIVESNILKLLKISHTINNEDINIKNGKFNKNVEIFINQNSIYTNYIKRSNFLYLYDNFKNLIGLISYFDNNENIEIIDIFEKINIKIDILELITNYFKHKNIFITLNKDWNTFNLSNKICEIEPSVYYIIKDKKTNIECEHKYKIYDSGKIIYKV